MHWAKQPFWWQEMTRAVWLGAAILVALAPLDDVRAQVDCGTIRAEDGPTVEMTRNVECPGSSIDTAITLEGPLTLRMRGNVLRCTTLNNGQIPSDGFRATDTRVRIIGPGLIVGCQDGVVLSGDGNHLVKNVTVMQASSLISSGVRIFSSSNTVKKLRVKNIGGVGISINGNSEGNKILNNQMTRTRQEGIAIFSSDSGDRKVNVIRGNSIMSTNLLNAGIRAADNAKIIKNEVSRSGGSGIDVRDDSDNVKILKNRVVQAGEDGIKVGIDASRNVVRGNEVRGSRGFDLADENQNCGSNSWVGNTFSSRNRSCIR